MATKTFGGVARINLSDGTQLECRSMVKYDPAGIEADVIVNQSGSVAKTVTLTGYVAEWEFQDVDDDTFERLLTAESINISFVEELTKVRAIWTDATFAGKPQTDRATGAVTGLRSVSRHFIRKSGA